MALSLTKVIYVFVALICAIFVSFTTTPVARVLAYKLGAIDVPKDNRRMHKVSMPLMGGLAIFLAFTVTVLAFCDLKKPVLGLLFGALFIVIVGILDDIYNLNPFVKLTLQVIAALIPSMIGITINRVNFFGTYFYFGSFSIPVTVLWIVAMTNAVNLIDGLDGLSCGVSAISAMTLLFSSFFLTETPYSAVLLTAILAGSCIGFLPFNFNPAKIFMGDTGSMFLGFTLALISIEGVFKTSAVFSFWVPFLSFALPLGDTLFAFVRRVAHGKNPFSGDRGHIHHKLMDVGFNQKQSVTILYAISGIFGVSALLFAIDKPLGSLVVIVSALGILICNWVLVNRSEETRDHTGLLPHEIAKLTVEVKSDGEKASPAAKTHDNDEEHRKDEIA